MSEYPALKNNFEKNWLATWLNQADTPDIIHANWEDLPLKERINALASQINEWLPKESTAKQIQMLTRMMPSHKPWKNGDMRYWPIFSWIELFAVDAPKESLTFLTAFTHLLTAEFAIRPLLMHHEEMTFSYLKKQLNHPDEHVRRWVSEGTRPRLPWGMQVPCLKQKLSRNLTLISPLINDPSPYVRKSVANHLNDMYREDADLALTYATQWWENNTAESTWIVKHGLRSAIKDGHAGALSLLGFEPLSFIQSDLQIHQASVAFDGEISFTFEGKWNKPSDVVIDYAMHFVRANGKTGKKVFKLKTCKQTTHVLVVKKHSFKPISTRRYYPGFHTIDILANGQVMASNTFELKKP